MAYPAKDFVMDLRASNAAPGDGWAFHRCLRREQQGESDLAWDVLRRHFRLGTMTPHIPQEHFCAKPVTLANKRTNIISGRAGLEAAIYGLSGFAHAFDGKLSVFPSPAPEGWYTITGYRFGSRRVDLRVVKQK